MAKSNSQPDVRVRLSAEGVQEVVNAFKTIQREAERAGKGGTLAGKGLGFLKGQASALAGVLPALTVGAAVAGFALLTKRSVDLADNLGKLEQKTGFTVETLSTLSFAARTADVDQEQLAASLQKSARFFDQYNRGADESAGAVERLFGSSKALQGLNQDQQLLRTVDALAKLGPGAQRTALAMQVFGKSGSELLPLIDDLGNGGFDKLREKAQRLGLVIDSDLAQSAQRAKDAFTDIQSEAEGITLQFASGFLPAIADIAEGLVEATTVDGVSAFRVLGEFAGNTLKGIVLLIASVVAGIVEIGAKVSALIQNVGRAAQDLINEGPGKAFENFKNNMLGDADRIDAFIQEREAKLLAALDGTNREAKRRRKPGALSGEDEDKARKDASKIAESQRKLTEARLDAEIAVLKAKNKAANDAEKDRFEQGLVSLEQYYADRRARINAEADKEIELLKLKLKAEEDARKIQQTRTLAKGETEGDRTKAVNDRKAEIAKLQGEIQVRQTERDADIAASNIEQLNATRELAKERLKAEADIAEAEGRRFDAERLNLEAEVAGLQRLKGESEAAFKARQDALTTAGTQKINFDELAAKGQAALQTLALDRQKIQDAVASGQIFAIQGEQLLMEKERERLPLLQQIAEAMKAAAITPEQIQAANDFAAGVNQIAIASDASGQRMAQFKSAVEDAISSDLNSFLTQGIQDAENLGDAFRGLALSVVDSLRQIATQMLVNILLQRIFKSIGGGFGFSSGGSVKAAGGGLISGPGTGTSDSIPARLSDGEFVVRSGVVKQPGVLEFLRTLNSDGTSMLRRRTYRGFAEGGLVDVGESGGAGSAGINATLALDEGLVLKKLEASGEFARVMVRTAENNRKKLNSALGRGAQ